MPLKLVIDKLDSVPEGIRGEYTEKDGKFYLNVDGIEDTKGLKSALERQKTELAALKGDLSTWKNLGLSADEIKTLKDAKEAAEAEAAKKAGNFDQILDQHKKKWDGEKSTLENKHNETLSWAKKATVDAGLSAALAKAKVTPEGIDLLMQVLPARVKFDFADGSPSIEILQADGKSPLAGSGADGAATYDDLVKDAVKLFPSLFEGSGGGGGGASSRGGRGTGSKTITRSDFDKMHPTARTQRIREGFTVVDS